MGLFNNLFGDDIANKELPDAADRERFPQDEYGVAYAVTVFEEDISAVESLIEAETETPRTDSPLFEEVFEEELNAVVGEPVEDHSKRIQKTMDVWKSQMESDPDTVWLPIGADTTFRLFLTRCETRAELDDDPFEMPTSIGRVLSLIERCKTAQENDSKLAVLPREHIPLDDTSK